MVKTNKLVKYVRHSSKAYKLALQVKKMQKKNAETQHQHQHQHQHIKSYKKNLQNHISKDTKYIVTKSKTKSRSKSLINNDNSLVSLISRKSKIIQPDRLIIPNMEHILESELVDKDKDKDKIPTTNLSIQSIQSIPSIANNNYVIAIPSYNRTDIIQTHTLALLNRHNIKPEHITIFVANKEEYDIYKSNVPEFLYNNLIIGALGLKNQRNFINAYYPEGTYIVEMDDDIQKIMQLEVKSKTSKLSKRLQSKTTKLKSKSTVKPIEDLDTFIRNAFNMCIERNIFLWGIYPLINPYFMSNKVTTDLRFIVGPMWGMINRHRKDLKLTIDEKENSERTLQFWVADGSVLRFNNIGISTKYYKNKGGMQSEGKNRKDEALKSVYYLNKMYPTLTKISLTKKSGMPEIKMQRIAVQ